jgi:hypothetical protein
VFARNRSQTTHERTAEERQRAREERERQRQGLPPVPDAPVAESHEPDAAVEELPVEELPRTDDPPTVEVPAPVETSAMDDPPPALIEEPPTEAPPPKRSRNVLARLGALVALIAVGGAIWLLAQSLGGSSTHKPPPPRVTKITIPEGYTRAHIAELAKDEGLKGDYLAASVRSPHLHPTHYGGPHGTPSLEGFLFPATYELYAGGSVRRLVNEQLAAFQENFTDAEIHRAHTLGVTPYQLLIVASMIEREAEVEHDRPLIAAVIYSRLRQGIPLGIDATIRYALNDFSAPLTEAQLRNPSPYNTRLHHGLPPTPIGNPGAASIHAAAHPAHVSYLYYVAAADGCGEHVFSSSYAQFEHDAAAYREAVAKNHGRVPTCHKK